MGGLMTSFLPSIGRSLDCLLPEPRFMTQSLLSLTGRAHKGQYSCPSTLILLRLLDRRDLKKPIKYLVTNGLPLLKTISRYTDSERFSIYLFQIYVPALKPVANWSCSSFPDDELPDL